MTSTETLKLQRAINAATNWGLKEDGRYGPETAEAYQYYINQQTPRSVPTPVPPAPKPWYLSRAVIGIMVAGVALVANYWGVEIDVEKATELAVTGAGLALAFVGTVRRRAPIDSAVVAPGVRIPQRAPKVPPDSPDVSHLRGPFGY